MPYRNSRLDQVAQVSWRRGRPQPECQRRYLVAGPAAGLAASEATGGVDWHLIDLCLEQYLP